MIPAAVYRVYNFSLFITILGEKDKDSWKNIETSHGYYLFNIFTFKLYFSFLSCFQIFDQMPVNVYRFTIYS